MDKRRLIAEMLKGKPVHASGYDPIARDIMEKTYAHDIATGDPLVTVGMGPFRVRTMHPVERPHNMGSYYPEEDLMFLNPDLSRRDMTDTAKHEFRHRGAHMLGQEGHGGDPTEEMMVQMMDLAQGVGDTQYVLDSMDYLKDHAEAAGAMALDLNAKARARLGGGPSLRLRRK